MTYRTNVTTIDDLEPSEQLALGGLLRILIRLDGSFSEEEERCLEEVADGIGGRDALWRVISRSAQEHKNDDDIRASAKAVSRSEARNLIRETLVGVAMAETIVPEEQRLIDWLDETWSA
ncbi:MAG: hypothetical protein H6720_16795 [Sandaracinus sp.]|nr:hypothetical protein [Sandaracinus sp.]